VTVRAGHCTDCGRLIWRAATAARDDLRSGIKAGTQYILWPDPTSLYARLETSTGYAPGVAFCRQCAPEPGTHVLDGFGPVICLESAHERYAAWYTENWGAVRRAWLRDALSLEPAQIDALMGEWNADRRG
jgi:hypothetical protein